MGFVHLHNHTEFSLLDGATKIDALVDRVSELGQDAVAITDHGWIAGAIKLTKACRKKGIKPIVGSEIYMATTKSAKKKAKGSGDNYHLTVMCQNEAGYRNLMMLSTLGFRHGLHFKPRIDRDTLAKHSEGLIVLSGCVGAELPQLVARGKRREVVDLIDFYLDTFGDRFFIEIMAHGATGGIDHVRVDEGDTILMTETDLNRELAMIANLNGIPLVATNDAHYLEREHGEAHDTLLCIGTGSRSIKGQPDTESRLKFPGVDEEAWEFYVKGGDEMQQISDEPFWEAACDQTVEVANLVSDDPIIPMGNTILPPFEVPQEGEDPEYDEWLRTGILP